MNKKKHKPSVSVIIPVYNTEKYLSDCLDSIINQTFDDIEIVCIDDGSTDLSFKILEEYKNKDERIQILQQKNQGAAVARNKGIELSAGKYLMFLDSDDYFDLNFIKELFEKAEENNADLVVCSTKKVDKNGNIDENENPLWPINTYKTPVGQVFEQKKFKNCIFDMFCVIPWNKLYLAEMIEKNNIKFQNLSSSNDVFFGCVCKIFADRIFVTDKKLAYYRYERNGNISDKRAEKIHNTLKACIHLKNFLLEKELFNTYKEAFYSFFTNNFRSELSRCNEQQYKDFLLKLKQFMPEDWILFEKSLRKETVTLQKLKEVIGEKKVFLWGASLFLENLLKEEKEKNPNIIGVIDKNISLQGKTIGKYTIYSPEILNTTPPDAILLTVFSNNETVYKALQEELKNTHPDIELLENIFS